MYTNEEMTHDYVREELGIEEIDRRVQALDPDGSMNSIAQLHGDGWKPEQVYEFAQLAKQWMDGEQEVRIFCHRYNGLEIRQNKTREQLEQTVLDNECQRRSTANWKEKQDDKKATDAKPYVIGAGD